MQPQQPPDYVFTQRDVDVRRMKRLRRLSRDLKFPSPPTTPYEPRPWRWYDWLWLGAIFFVVVLIASIGLTAFVHLLSGMTWQR